MGIDSKVLPDAFLSKMDKADRRRLERQSVKEVGKTETLGSNDVPRARAGGGASGITKTCGAVITGGAISEQNTRTFTIYQDPVAAPRMTRRDKWLKPRRPCVERYFIYRDILRGMVGDIPIVPDEVNAVFHFAMPESWSKKRRQEMNGKPHRQRPDGDNCTKAIQDALFLEDGGVWRGAFEKRWAIHGRVELTMVWR